MRAPLALRIALTAIVLAILGMPALVAGIAAWTVVPRETCQWRDEDFCSDHGGFYLALCVLLALALSLALWAIHRRRKT